MNHLNLASYRRHADWAADSVSACIIRTLCDHIESIQCEGSTGATIADSPPAAGSVCWGNDIKGGGCTRMATHVMVCEEHDVPICDQHADYYLRKGYPVRLNASDQRSGDRDATKTTGSDDAGFAASDGSVK